jgi:mRNA-degrading endonuclease YafQ of YafQ-DinJ toxin-antitoxin module
MYITLYNNLFIDHLKRFTIKEQRVIERKIELLKNDVDHPSLRTKKLDDDGLHESSVSMDIRVIWQLRQNVMVLMDVGHHDILKKYG